MSDLSSKTLAKWPERIYLQRDYECAEEGCGPHSGDDGETTWCKDKIHDTDVEYVRADLARVSDEPETALDDHSELLKNLPNVHPDLVAELEKLSKWALVRRVLIQADWLGSYSKCLDGLDLRVGVDGCWNPRDIRAAVEKLRAAEPPDDVQRDAERWRALIGCARIRVMGSAGLHDPQSNYAHIGVEFWTHHPAQSTPEAIETILKFVERAALTKNVLHCPHDKDPDDCMHCADRQPDETNEAQCNGKTDRNNQGESK